MTLTPSPSPHSSNRKPSKLSGQKQQWSFTTKVMALAVSVSMLPVLLLGTGAYLGGQLIYRQTLQVQGRRQASSTLQTPLTSLLIATGVTAVLAGASAVFLANRAVYRVIKASKTSTKVVNRLLREESDTHPTDAHKDELVALETNLKLIEQQLPDILWRQEAAAERSQLLMNISHHIWGARSEEEVLRTAVEEVRQAFKTDRVIVFRFDRNWDGSVVEESVAPGWPKALWSTVHDPCFAEEYIEKYRQGRVHAIDNIYEADTTECHIALLERFAVKANLVAPIIRENQLYGLLIAHQCSSPRVWQNSEKTLLAQLAAQVSFALDHAKLLEQVDAKASQLQLFIDITRRIRASLIEEDILKTTVEEIRKAIRTDRVIVFGFDANWYGIVLAESVVPGFPKALRAEIEDPCFVNGYVDQYQAGRVRAIANIYEADLTDCHINQLERFAVQANLVAPILKDDKLFGLLIAHQCSKTRNWEQEEIDLFAQLAMQVGFALDHARLLNKLEQAYQVSETASQEQYQQKEALQRQVLALLKQHQKSVQILTQEALSQRESVQVAYERIQAVADLSQGISSVIEQMKLYRHQVNQEVQAAYEAMVRVLDSIVTIRQVIVEAPKKINPLEETSKNLTTAIIPMGNEISQLNLQAMNIALEATRNGNSEQQVSAIAGKVVLSTRQLKESLAETERLINKIQAETQDVMVAIRVGTEQVTTGAQLVDITREKLSQIATVNTQMDSLIEEITQVATKQIQSSAAANQVILEVASVVNYASEEFTAVVKSFNQLAAIAQEYPDDAE
ncbi:MAG: GAF domain-containing protein [Scytonema sp. PMC 1069.18]|nr:GAF domain-containing protein [Scytonema sp. PMC 1069.18]MEC4881413.1 GAF domain-containing protein [Scytonema sp. PMC 1070.18]